MTTHLQLAYLIMRLNHVSVLLQKCNVNGMNLVAGEGNKPGRLVEGDKINTVYVLVGPPI
jgi:hypothetical protein